MWSTPGCPGRTGCLCFTDLAPQRSAPDRPGHGAHSDAAVHFDRIRRRGRSAETRLVAMTRFLVDGIAGEYVGRRFDRGKLVGVGNEALSRAAAEFDPRRGAEFGDYAARCIREMVAQAAGNADKTSSADLLSDAAADSVTILRHRRLLLRRFGREPTLMGVAQARGCAGADQGGPRRRNRPGRIGRQPESYAGTRGKRTGARCAC